MKNKKGFTLIELLAVIVILAIIAVIAIPVVLNIVDEAEKSALIVSSENYKKVVEQTILKDSLNDTSSLLSTECEIDEDGNLICVGIKDVIKIDINGEKPKLGQLKIEKGQITNMRLEYEEGTFVTSNDGDIITSEYELGEEVKIKSSMTFEPGMKWYVIGESEDSVNLMLNFYPTESSWGTATNDGPINVMNSVIKMFEGVYEEYGEKSGLELIKDYTYTNNEDGKKFLYGYQKIEIKNGITTITKKDGTSIALSGKTYARIITEEEYINVLRNMPNLSLLDLNRYILENINIINEEYSTNYTTVDEIFEHLKMEKSYLNTYLIAYLLDSLKDDEYNEIKPQPWVYENMYTEEVSIETLGYWTLTSRSNDKNNIAKLIFTYGMPYDTESITSEQMVGPRPVITISKSKIERVD